MSPQASAKIRNIPAGGARASLGAAVKLIVNSIKTLRIPELGEEIKRWTLFRGAVSSQQILPNRMIYRQKLPWLRSYDTARTR
jgi:hypothetical protein